MSITSETTAVILEIRMRRLASNFWQAVLVDDAELAAVAATPGGARGELRALVSIALGVPAAMVLFSASTRSDNDEGKGWESPAEPLFQVLA
ncbi:MAG: hypothetical protein M0Z47_00870 [Actinomycetota bacterium]|nr:hypothetical protein [Actinomycetota bacterium]